MDVKEILKKSHKIGVISHINPDADNLGSLTAMTESLRLYGKDVYGICIDTIPYNLLFLKGIENLTKEWDRDYDLLIALDSSSLDRFGSASNIVNKAKYTINIDHHITNDLNFDINILKPKASSTGEVLYKFLKEYDLPISKDVAESIYTAIVSDSGSFKYDTVSSETFIIASELIKLGIDRDKINKNLFGKNRLEKLKLLKIVIDRMEIVPEKNFIYSYLTTQDFKENNALDADIEGIVEFLRDIDNIEVAILFRENSKGFKGSMRSKSYYDCSSFSQKFGGGGHIRAAGFTIEDKNIENVIKKVKDKI